MSDTASVSLIMPVFNAERYLPTTLPAALEASRTHPDAELIVVDNGSTDRTPEIVEKLAAGQARVEHVPAVKVGGVRNHGASVARGDVLVFIDADVVIPPDYVATALGALEETRADVTGSLYELPREPVWVESAWHHLHGPTKDGPVNYINSGNLVCRRAAFDAVGGFDPSLESGEDAELGARFRAHGFTVYQVASVRGTHLGNPKSLADFFRKQVWHGMGAFGTFRKERLDKPLLLTVLHSIASLTGLVGLVARPSSASGAIALSLMFVAPVLAVFYRALSGGRLRAVPAGVLLYWVYFTARFVSLLKLARRRIIRTHA